MIIIFPVIAIAVFAFLFYLTSFKKKKLENPIVESNNPVCEYQIGDVIVCEECNKSSFYLSIITEDLYGPVNRDLKVVQVDWWMDSTAQNGNENHWREGFWCRHCGHKNIGIDREYAIRYSCPECNKTNVTILEPSEINTKNKFKCYTNTEVICQHCEKEFLMRSIIHDIDGPFWITKHLFKK